MAKTEVKKDNKSKQLADAISFASKLFLQKTEGCEGFMLSINVVKDGRIAHTHSYQNFKTGDWGACLIAMGVEARMALMNASTGVSKAR